MGKESESQYQVILVYSILYKNLNFAQVRIWIKSVLPWLDQILELSLSCHKGSFRLNGNEIAI